MISTGRMFWCAGITAGNARGVSSAPVNAASSRATPYTLRQCARLGVSLRVNSVSSSARYSRILAPTGASPGNSSKPALSSDSLSSRAEHSMPWLSTPLSFPSLIRKGLPSSPGGKEAPTRAHGTRMPSRAFGAPQTMDSGSPPWPASTLHTRRRSAFGCWTASRIRATTTPENGGQAGCRSSTSSPAMVRVSANCWVVRFGLQ